MHVVLMILGFVWWWPVGLAMLVFLMAKRRRWRRMLAGGEAMFAFQQLCGSLTPCCGWQTANEFHTAGRGHC